LLLLMISGILISQVVKKDWSFAKDPISSILLFWIYYNIFQALNPSQESKMAWLFTVRSLAILNLLYFIACYAFTSFKRIHQVLNLIVGLATFAALYGLKQEFMGFSSAEKAWIYADPERFQLFFQWGRMRTFSLFNDAMTFGIMMAYMGLFCLIYATAPMKNVYRVLLVTAGFVMFWSSIYTGTRTCFALIPMGFAFYALMTLRKEVLIGFVAFLMFGAVLVIKGGNSNAVLFRVKSAFEPSEDASVQIRYFNQKRPTFYLFASDWIWPR
jgi:putative inorganic carbon (hco3(-)) transporter